jgi:hypothetical protein
MFITLDLIKSTLTLDLVTYDNAGFPDQIQSICIKGLNVLQMDRYNINS